MASLFRRNQDPKLIEKQGTRNRGLAVQDIDWTDPNKVADDDIADLTLEQYRLGKQRRQAWEAQAAQQLAWARGNQHLVWNEDTRDLVAQVIEDKPLEFRDPVYINTIKPNVLTYIGMVVGQPLSWSVTPATRDDDDVAGAQVLGKLMAHYWTAGRQQQRKLIDMLWMVCCTGLAFIKPLWDPTLGESDRFTKEVMRDAPAEATGESRRQRRKLGQRWEKYLAGKGQKADDDGGVDIPRGDLQIDFPSGFDITEPEQAKDIPTCGWLIESQFKTIEYLRERYGVEVPPTEETEFKKYRSFEQYGDYYAYTGHSGQHLPTETTLVHEFWRARGPGCPKGFRAAVSHDGQVLAKGPHPYVHGHLPYIRVTEMPEPDYFRPGCTVRDLMPLQRARNKQRSMLHGHLETCVDPRVLVPKDAGIPDDTFQRGPKQVPVNSGVDTTQIKALVMPAPPPYMGALDDMNKADMEQVAGVHRSTTGKAESAQQSGKHAQIMREQDAQRLGVLRQITEESFAEAGMQMGWLLWEFVSAERSISVVGPDRRSQVVRFKGGDLSKNKPFGPFAFNVRVRMRVEPDMDSVYQRIEVLSKSGYLSPERDDDRLLVMRWLGEMVPDETDAAADHRHNANAENDAMMQGQTLRAAYGDDDAVHIEAHMHATTTGRYRRSMRQEPNVDLVMRLHIRDHLFNKADKEFRPVALAKRVQSDLIKEYGLMPPKQPTIAGPGGAPGPGGPAGGAGAGPPGGARSMTTQRPPGAGALPATVMPAGAGRV